MKRLLLTVGIYLLPAVALADTMLSTEVLPQMRSVQVGSTATAFATVINAVTEVATSVGVTAEVELPNAPTVDFLYQTVDFSGHLTGTANTPVDIPPGGTQMFLLALTPHEELFDPLTNPVTVIFTFQGTNTLAAPRPFFDFQLYASNTQPPDFIPIAATCSSNDGIPTLNIPGRKGAAAFGVTVINAGASGRFNFGVNGPIGTHRTVCRTNAQGSCLSPPVSSDTFGAIGGDRGIMVTLQAGEIATFSVFVYGKGARVPFDPAKNRIGVEFVGGSIGHTTVLRGFTSLAVRTHRPACSPQ